MDSISLSNSLSKGSVYESDSICNAYREDALSRLEDGARPEAISNEEIRGGDVILETYTVEDDAVHGGMGSVWRVHHSGWNTDLAMKRPQPRFFSEGSEARKAGFIAECENWINLGLHPNIVSCYYVREIGGVPTVFSEWMDGGSLKDAIQSGRLYRGTGLRKRLIDIAIQSARGLRYSHENGLLHQDIKPGNLLLTRGWDVKVADFGLAKGKLQLAEGAGTALTTGYTLAYCPSQQAGGAAAEKWMDVYAWALTMLEMFLRRRPWDRGADVPEAFDGMCKGCRNFPGGMRALLKSCLSGKLKDFAEIEAKLTDIYVAATGEDYPRPASDAARDNAVSLNNRALSFLDLGRPGEAERLWEVALEKNVSDFFCRYNYAVYLWKQRRIEYEELRERVTQYGAPDGEAARLTDAVIEIAGDPAEDKGFRHYRDQAVWYTQIRPEEEPFSRLDGYRHPRPDVSAEGGAGIVMWAPSRPHGRRPAWTARRGDGGIVLKNEREEIVLPGEALLDVSADGGMALYTDAEERVHVMNLRTRETTGVTFQGEKRFASLHGGILADTVGALDLYDAATGCKLGHRLYPNEPGWSDQGGDFIGFVLPNGPILYAPVHAEAWETIPTPRAGVRLPFVPSRVQSFDAVREAEERLKNSVPAAAAALKAGDHAGARVRLEPFCQSGIIVHSEEALRLWTALGRHYEPAELLAVVPTDDAPSPEPARRGPGGIDAKSRGKNRAGNGTVLVHTEVSRLQEHEGYTGDVYADIEWSLTGYDALSPDRKVFFIPLLDSETQRDEEKWFTELTPSFSEDGRLRWPVSQLNRDSRGREGIDLADPETQRQLRMEFFLPAGEALRNTDDGLLIGGTLFDDAFEGCYPLWDARIIRGRRRNYRLVYRYGEAREATPPPLPGEPTTISLSNTLSKGSVVESDSVCVGAVDDMPDSLSNEQIQKGDVITRTYTVADDAIRGGMGSVWRVHHAHWNTDLAMKRPQPRFFAEAGEQRKAEFISECEHWIDLGLHPNIVSCYYVREIGGVPTIFSEWMDGGSLKDAITSGRLYGGTDDEVQARILDIAIQAARGLQYSHEKGLIHQDVKPANILLSKDFDAKVADFGLAKARSQLTGGRQAVSSGYTLQYCPKQQAEGARAEAWMDVYAWALTVIEMYAGERLWQTGAEAGQSVDALMKTCRVPIPGELRIVLGGAVNRAYSAFPRIAQRLEQIYARVCGRDYQRPDPEAARDIADSMNNRALSFIELGQPERALEALEAAVLQDGTNARCQYNRALLRWNMNLAAYGDLRRIVRLYDDGSPEFAAVREQVEKIADPDSRKVPVQGERTRTDVSDTKHDILEKTEDGVIFEVNGVRHVAPGDALLGVSPDGKRALSCQGDWNHTGYYLTDLQSGDSVHVARTWCSDKVWLNPPRFCDAEGTVITTQKRFEGVYVFDAASGRGLMYVEASQGEDSYTDGEEALETFYSDGTISISSNAKRELPDRNPRIDVEPDYLLSKIKSYGEQTEKSGALARTHAEAKRALEHGHCDRTRALLEPFVQSKDIFLMPESLDLWGDLSRFYEKERLLTVLPQAREGGGEYVPDLAFRHPETLLPPGTKNDENCNHGKNECYGVTIHYDYRCYENYNNSFDIDSDWDLTAYERDTNRVIFSAYLMGESQTDETDWDQELYVGFFDKAHMWYTKRHMRDYATIDLREKKPGFRLADGSIVQNRDDGLHIGELVFDDVYEGCESLLDADVIRGRKQDYRLIYTYGEPRPEVKAPESAEDGDASREAPAEAAPADEKVAEAYRNADFETGKVIVWDYEIQGKPIHTVAGCVFRVHKAAEDIDMAMVRPEPGQGKGEAARRTRLRAAFDGWQALGVHENIVTCFESVDVGGMPTAFCEWIDGGSLADAIQNESLYAGSAEEVQARVFGIAMQAARALKHIHSSGIVHCDVKPAKLLIDGNSTAKFNDFGLSARIDADAPSPGFTLAYCPKEQIEGRSAKPWMDVYAWSLTVLEMYAGRMLWKSGTEVAEHFDEYLALCRVAPPGNLPTLLRLCLRWKVSDGAVIVKELEAIARGLRAAETPSPGSISQRDEPPARENASAQSDKAGSGPSKPEDRPEQAKPGLFGRIRRALFGK